MDASLYTWNFIWNWRLYLTVVSKKKLTICLTRYRNYNKEKICVIKRSFIHPRWQGITEFLSKIYLNSYTQELRIYSIVFPLFSSERLKAGLNILNWSYIPSANIYRHENIVNMFHNVETLKKRKTGCF